MLKVDKSDLSTLSMMASSDTPWGRHALVFTATKSQYMRIDRLDTNTVFLQTKTNYASLIN